MIDDMTCLKYGQKWEDADIGNIKRIFIIGSSGVGKTSLVNFLKSYPDLADKVHVPLRYITRPARQNDDLQENRHVDYEIFQELVDKDEINIHWQRDLGGNQYERYGFASIHGNKMPLYSANMALVKADNAIAPSDILENSLLIGVYLPEDKRIERFSARSPDVMQRKEEIQKRFSDKTDDVFDTCHIVVDNQSNINIVGEELCRFISKIATA